MVGILLELTEELEEVDGVDDDDDDDDAGAVGRDVTKNIIENFGEFNFHNIFR